VPLHTQAWGDPGAPLVVCLHGVGGHGGRFRKLAEERLLPRFRVVAADLRGHGRSTWDEPWDIATHLADLLETFDEPAVWIGHSFGGRLIMHVAAEQPGLVERAVLLDPAIFVPSLIAEDLASEARREESFASLEEALEARLTGGTLAHTPREVLIEEIEAHAVAGEDGRLRYRYSGNCVGEAYLQMATAPPPFESLRLPTLVVVGALSKITSAGEVELYRRALGDLFQLEVVPGGHSVLWDAFEETADAVTAFLDG
jgi:lipase